MVSDRAGGGCMISIEGTQEMADRWQEHLAYIKILGNRNNDWIHVAPTTQNKVLKLYQKCGSISKVAKDLHLARKTVGKILNDAGVPA
jgi:DNA invertase Pin-like site-specific DNA recombinase